MPKLNVALLQMVASDNQNENLKKGIEVCRKAKEMGADIVLFPEMFNTGYQSYDPSIEGDHEKWLSGAITKDDDFVKSFQDLAKELNIAIVITYLEKWDNMPRNTASLIDCHGKIVITYAKIHTCDFDVREASITPGQKFYVYNLDTEKGNVKIGIMICFDREFPESARILMLKGAEIILTPNSCDLDDQRIDQFKTRAFENMVGVAMANYNAPACNGNSVAYDATGKLIIQAGEKEGIYMAEFDLDKLRKDRKEEVLGNAFRKPHRYKDLTSMKVEEPFVRKNAFGKIFDREER